MVLERVASTLLRIGQLAFAATVLGLIANYLHHIGGAGDSEHKKRFIYTEVVAAISLLLALLWLLPFAGGFIHWPVDLILFILWIVAFGLLAEFITNDDCGGASNTHWGNVAEPGACSQWKSALSFAFLSAIFWLASALLGLYFVRKHRAKRSAAVADGPGTNTEMSRNAWYRNPNNIRT